jgi:hypothetical protein
LAAYATVVPKNVKPKEVSPVAAVSLAVKNPTWLNEPDVVMIYNSGFPEKAEVFDVAVQGVLVASPYVVKVMLLAMDSQDGALFPIYAKPNKN